MFVAFLREPPLPTPGLTRCFLRRSFFPFDEQSLHDFSFPCPLRYCVEAPFGGSLDPTTLSPNECSDRRLALLPLSRVPYPLRSPLFSPCRSRTLFFSTLSRVIRARPSALDHLAPGVSQGDVFWFLVNHPLLSPSPPPLASRSHRDAPKRLGWVD